jgi:hypothetical protein
MATYEPLYGDYAVEEITQNGIITAWLVFRWYGHDWQIDTRLEKQESLDQYLDSMACVGVDDGRVYWRSDDREEEQL